MSASEWTLNAVIGNGSQSRHHIVKHLARYGLSAWHQEAKRRSPPSLSARHKNEVSDWHQEAKRRSPPSLSARHKNEVPGTNETPTCRFEPVDTATVAGLADATPCVGAQAKGRPTRGYECRFRPVIDLGSKGCSCGRRAGCPSRSSGRVVDRSSYQEGSLRTGGALPREGNHLPPLARPNPGCPVSLVCPPL
jgi:hypothetical protein